MTKKKHEEKKPYSIKQEVKAPVRGKGEKAEREKEEQT